MSAQRGLKQRFSTGSFGKENGDEKNGDVGEDYEDLIGGKLDSELEPQGVDPGKGWHFRGVHKVCDACESSNCSI